MKARYWMISGLLVLAPGAWAQSAPADTADTARDGSRAAESRAGGWDDPRCLRHTGSRITAARQQRPRTADTRRDSAPCAPVAGRVHTREEIDRTGAIDLADALRRLDPAIR
ncbi:hypothetical protein EBB59_04835 [Lysobacter pythonis]|uniref:Uncharacterized protein n=1 Tax=Solilutibacter pythonis TaxID=2483112 RepID=A0A3M2I0X2_9GAMM|nr:hypothetical protein [Lysobacter pythonis]RMH93570.1 hypothetical protein EBB59_04835 [Lysobacter pythonis]